MSDNLKLLRYNTGTDKQVFIKFKNDVSAVIFNATIVAYSSSAVADLVSVHKNQYIIDPQTHIFQHTLDAIQTKGKNGDKVIKKSVLQYFDELPGQLKERFFSNNGALMPADITPCIDELVDAVYDFETKYVTKYVKKKEYDKYLEFVKLGPSPMVVIAPYFMIKSSYDNIAISSWMRLNRIAAKKFEEKNEGKHPIGIQIVIDQEILERQGFINEVTQAYSDIEAEFAFIWIDKFESFSTSSIRQEQFKALLQAITSIGLKPVMAYGGYDAILLCNKELPFRMYGVAQSVGYGESREITPVGGGVPVNKYYFPPLHSRLNMSEVLQILMQAGFFSIDKKVAANRFYSQVCGCKQCRAVIKDNIDNFYTFNDSIPFTIRGAITRNRPTTDANLISSMHFMYAKMSEWDFVENNSFAQSEVQLIDAYAQYKPTDKDRIAAWCDLYEK